MIYFDASAMVTYLSGRPNFAALYDYLDSRRDLRAATSTLGPIETVRTCDRIGNYPNLLAHLLRQYSELEITSEIRDEAASLPGPLTTLNAIHVVTAETLGDHLAALITYDRQLALVARARGLPVASPGANF